MAIKRRFICYDDNGNPRKYWRCWVEKNKFIAEWGRIDGPPTSKTLTFNSNEQAQEKERAMILAKTTGRWRNDQFEIYREVEPVEFETTDEYLKRKLAQEFKKHRKREKRTSLGKHEVIRMLVDWFKKAQWEIRIDPRKTEGPYVIANKGNAKWIIAAKGEGKKGRTRAANFYSAIGEVLFKMDDIRAKYCVAFPDISDYRDLWADLPRLAKSRTGIAVFFVGKKEKVEAVRGNDQGN